MKSWQIVEKTSFQRICSIWSKTQKQHESIHEKKALWRIFKRWNNRKKLKKFLHCHLNAVEWIWFNNKYCLFTRKWLIIKIFQKLWILQYNVHKLKNKMIITLLHEMKIKDYNILMIQESWRHYKKTKMYNSRDIDFILKNNKEKTCFYVNNRIDDNNWHNTWHFKNVKIIIL